MAKQILLYIVFHNAHDPVAVQQRIYKEERNRLIRTRHAAGEALSDLAREYEISPQRVWQIVNSPSGRQDMRPPKWFKEI